MSTTQETKIDWSKPVQTKETPPRKVEIVTTNGRGEYPVIGYVGSDLQFKQWRLDGVWATKFPSHYDLQNTPQQPEQWAAEKAAFAAGETIQYRSDTNPTWSDTKEPMWLSPLGYTCNPQYRIKPKQQKVQLEPDDIKAGDEFLDLNGNRLQWLRICKIDIGFQFGSYSYKHIMELGWKIRSLGETEWRECYKLIDPK
jgi:hypothetical protein